MCDEAISVLNNAIKSREHKLKAVELFVQEQKREIALAEQDIVLAKAELAKLKAASAELEKSQIQPGVWKEIRWQSKAKWWNPLTWKDGAWVDDESVCHR